MHSFYYRPPQLSSAVGLCLLRHMHSVTTTTTTNITGMESNPSRHIHFPHTRSNTCIYSAASRSKLNLTCRTPVPVQHFSHSRLSIRCRKSTTHFSFFFLFARLSPPSASLTNLPLPHSVPLFPCLALQLHMRRKLFLFNSLQHQPINSFTDGLLGPCGAG